MNPKSPVQVIKAEKVVNLPVKMARTEHVCELEIHRLQLNLVGDNEVLPADIILFYQPDSWLFSWSFHCYSDEQSRQQINKNWEDPLKVRNSYLHDEQIFIYCASSRMTHFAASQGVLFIRDFRQRCSCIEDVYNRVIFILENNLSEIEQLNYYKWRSIICLDDYLESHFFYRKKPEVYTTIIIPVTKITHVSRLSSLWLVDLEGCHQKKATLILRNKQDNQEEPILLTDDYYKNRRRVAVFRSSDIRQGLPVPEDDYEVLDVWVECVKKEIL
jgi:hypothetical protein